MEVLAHHLLLRFTLLTPTLPKIKKKKKQETLVEQSFVLDLLMWDGVLETL